MRTCRSTSEYASHLNTSNLTRRQQLASHHFRIVKDTHHPAVWPATVIAAASISISSTITTITTTAAQQHHRTSFLNVASER
jgi:hypothetical protein